MKHPLVNPESSGHYCMFDGVESITLMEKLMTTEELKAWCKGNIYKYRFRIGNKDSVESDSRKIKTYEDYYKYLLEKV